MLIGEYPKSRNGFHANSFTGSKRKPLSNVRRWEKNVWSRGPGLKKAKSALACVSLNNEDLERLLYGSRFSLLRLTHAYFFYMIRIIQLNWMSLLFKLRQELAQEKTIVLVNCMFKYWCIMYWCICIMYWCITKIEWQLVLRCWI